MYESPEDKKEYQEAPWKTRGRWEPQKEAWGKTILREGLVWVRDIEVQNAGGRITWGEYEYSEQAGRAQAMVTVAWWEAADMVWRDGNYDSNQ